MIALGITATPAFAGTGTAVMPVTALVLENCAITATPMAFGTLTNFGSANIDSSSTLALVCTPNADFVVSLDDGSNALGGTRRLKNPLTSEYINYDIFLDAARAQHWGSNTGTDSRDALGTVIDVLEN
jgi:spore coat protein U-like protein